MRRYPVSAESASKLAIAGVRAHQEFIVHFRACEGDGLDSCATCGGLWTQMHRALERAGRALDGAAPFSPINSLPIVAVPLMDEQPAPRTGTKAARDHEIRRRWLAGEVAGKIADAVGMTRQGVQLASKRLGLPPRGPGRRTAVVA